MPEQSPQSDIHHMPSGSQQDTATVHLTRLLFTFTSKKSEHRKDWLLTSKCEDWQCMASMCFRIIFFCFEHSYGCNNVSAISLATSIIIFWTVRLLPACKYICSKCALVHFANRLYRMTPFELQNLYLHTRWKIWTCLCHPSVLEPQ
jgi:hypothetical protein